MRTTELHYENKNNKYDVIDFIKDYNINFNLGNVIKYISRLGKKDARLRELRKAMTYLQREIEYEEEQQRLDIERLRGQ